MPKNNSAKALEIKNLKERGFLIKKTHFLNLLTFVKPIIDRRH